MNCVVFLCVCLVFAQLPANLFNRPVSQRRVQTTRALSEHRYEFRFIIDVPLQVNRPGDLRDCKRLLITGRCVMNWLGVDEI